jgi:hypothetical protein
VTGPLELLLSNPNFAETASVKPVGATSWTTGITVRIRREAPIQAEVNGKRRDVRHQATLCVLSSLHATYSGLVTPQVGDEWKVPIQQGGTAVEGWMAGAAQPCIGGWLIQIVLVETYEFGKTRRETGS